MTTLIHLAHSARKLWWRIRKPQTLGVKVLVRNPAGEILLVQPSYASSCQIPGGGVNTFEHPLHAGIREIREETGIELAEVNMSLVEVLISKHEGKSDLVNFFTATCEDVVPQPDGNEIAGAGFYPPDSLPPNTASSVYRRLAGPSSDGIW